MGYCDVCKQEKDEMTMPCLLMEGKPRICGDCAMGDLHVDGVHGGDLLAVMFCGVDDGAEKMFPKRMVRRAGSRT
jgi:hypothetical protein